MLIVYVSAREYKVNYFPVVSPDANDLIVMYKYE